MTLTPFETTYVAGRRTVRGVTFHATAEAARAWFDAARDQLAIDHGVKSVRLVAVVPTADPRAV